MIRLSKMADYGIVVVTHLSRGDAKPVSAADVANETHIPAPTASKIMKMLTRSGILHSIRGAQGGYELARSGGDITVADVIEAMDGPIALTACIDVHDDSCGIESLCPARSNWQRINDAIRGALDNVTIEDMSNTIPSAFRAGTTFQPAEKNGAA